MDVLIFLAGLLVGMGVTWLMVRSRVEWMRGRLEEEEHRRDEEIERLTETFRGLSAEALRENNASFIELANQALAHLKGASEGDLRERQVAIAEMIKPVRESLEKVDQKIQELERSREGAYQKLTEQVRGMSTVHEQLRHETHLLASALRSPVARGRWGEIQLRRVVELAGMTEYCDFETQVTFRDEHEEKVLRPDMVVHLPNGRRIVIDAKTPQTAYLEALEKSDPEEQKAKLLAHSRLIRAHIDLLGKKAYWKQFERSPEFVVLFLPGESFFSAALEADPGLIDYGSEKRVLIATPTTLISLLKTVSLGWQQERLSVNAEEISRLGRELYKRIGDLGERLAKLGRCLNNTVESFNSLVVTTESRVLVTARRFEAMGVTATDAPGIPSGSVTIEKRARPLNSPELAEREFPASSE